MVIIAEGPDNEKMMDQSLAGDMAFDPTAKTLEQYIVYLVEDDLDDRKQMLRTLRMSPYISDIQCFATCDQLIAHFVKEGYYSGNLMRYLPTLIMLDIYMPGMSGIDMLRNLKEHPLTKDMPVIIISSDASHEKNREAFKFKANAFLQKPLSLEHVHKVFKTGWDWPQS